MGSPSPAGRPAGRWKTGRVHHLRLPALHQRFQISTTGQLKLHRHRVARGRSTSKCAGRMRHQSRDQCGGAAAAGRVAAAARGRAARRGAFDAGPACAAGAGTADACLRLASADCRAAGGSRIRAANPQPARASSPRRRRQRSAQWPQAISTSSAPRGARRFTSCSVDSARRWYEVSAFTHLTVSTAASEYCMF